MSVVATNASSTFAGNGATTAFPFTFACRNAADLAVYVAGTLQIAGFSVALNSDYNGGTVTFTVAPANGAAIIIASSPSFEQQIEFENAGPYNPADVDGMADAAAIRAIFLKGLVDRAPLVPLGETMGAIPAKAARAGLTFGFDAQGDPAALNPGGADSALRTDLAANSGSGLVGWLLGIGGAVARTVQDKLRDRVHIKDFGAVGDGATDDSAALTAFWNSALAAPGKKHVLDARTFATTVAMPAITTSNVWIEGQGAHIHDAGTPQMSGTVLKYIGALAAGAKMIEVGPVSGAGNRRLANIAIRGIGVDCNTGLLGYGLSVKSIRHSDIDLVVLNAATRGVDMGVVPALAEDKNLQRCRFNLVLRQTEVAVPCYYLDGDAVSDVSMNEFWIDAVYKNSVAGIHANSDNNQYRFWRANKASGGTATESVSLFGGASSAVSCRGEIFDQFSATDAAHVYGTEAYTVASVGHYFNLIDTENATPVPILGTGATAHYEKNETATAEDPWLSYVPTVASQTGTITTVGAVSGSYRKLGKRVEFKVQVPITTNGSGATSLNIGLPINAAGTVGSIVTGRETALTGKDVTGFISTGGSVVTCLFYDGTYPGADGRSFNLSGFYEVA